MRDEHRIMIGLGVAVLLHKAHISATIKGEQDRADRLWVKFCYQRDKIVNQFNKINWTTVKT